MLLAIVAFFATFVDLPIGLVGFVDDSDYNSLLIAIVFTFCSTPSKQFEIMSLSSFLAAVIGDRAAILRLSDKRE